jgi:hypothetical protein
MLLSSVPSGIAFDLIKFISAPAAFSEIYVTSPSLFFLPSRNTDQLYTYAMVRIFFCNKGTPVAHISLSIDSNCGFIAQDLTLTNWRR